MYLPKGRSGPVQRCLQPCEINPSRSFDFPLLKLSRKVGKPPHYGHQKFEGPKERFGRLKSFRRGFLVRPRAK
jgi:hypothetical protein